MPGASEEPVREGGSRSAFAQARMAAGSGNLNREGRDGGAGVGAVVGSPRERGLSRPAVGVLADRIAASLVHHEPGWRLPRHTALARRYNVSTAEIDAAVDELSTRHLVRRLPDGQLYRVSPAEYLIPIEGVPGLGSFADPVGVVRVQWTANGEPAAFCTSYLLKEIAGPFINAQASQGAGGLSMLPITAPAQQDAEHGNLVPVGEPRAVHVEMQPPPPSVARSLRLSAGQAAALVTVRFDDLDADRPVALTIAVFRPDLFRIVVESGNPLVVGGGASRAGGPSGSDGSTATSAPRGEGTFSAAWTHAVEDWEP